MSSTSDEFIAPVCKEKSRWLPEEIAVWAEPRRNGWFETAPAS